ncbi:MAG: hypothetical protein ACE5K2_00725 [Candidatus Zixiibacteriota bacterium]
MKKNEEVSEKQLRKHKLECSPLGEPAKKLLVFQKIPGQAKAWHSNGTLLSLIFRKLLSNSMKLFIHINCLLLILSGFSFFDSISASAVDEESYSCMVCHGEQKVEYKESIHYKRRILCHDCHGGDPTSLEEEVSMSKRAGFVGRPTKRRLTSLCGDCHADRERMKPFGIPTHQLEDYKTSQHGIALFERNDPNTATCTDCHGTHRIFLADNPESKVFPTNLPHTCAECHSNKELMDRYNLPSNTFEEYSKGIHGVFLLEKNDRSAPSCARCHGNHGALPPGVMEVEHVCGQCHITAADNFDQSPHLAAMERREMAQCISCHEHHRTQKAKVDMLGPVCTRCHDQGSGAYKRGQQIKTLIVKAQEEIEEAESIVAEAKLKGVDVTEDEVGLERAKSNLLQAIPKIHALNLTLVEEGTVQAKSLASDIKLRIHEIFESFRLRKVALGIVWLFILFTVTVLYVKKKRADTEFDLQKKTKENMKSFW